MCFLSGIDKPRLGVAGEVFMNVSRSVAKALKRRISLIQAFAVLVILTLLFSTANWQAKHALFEESLYLAGVALVALCVVGRAWSLSYISGNKNKKLINTGPYSICRNPLYFSNFVGAVGLGLCTETLILTFSAVAVFALIYNQVIKREEKKLLDLFGVQYASYSERVPRFLPSFKVFKEDDRVIVSAKAFRMGLTHLGAFVIAIGLIQFIEALHAAHLLPIFFMLY
jgi:protein-S-isoprenylcysteine O-methyltransferase Ste14